jgi:hypothetical protein
MHMGVGSNRQVVHVSEEYLVATARDLHAHAHASELVVVAAPSGLLGGPGARGTDRSKSVPQHQSHERLVRARCGWVPRRQALCGWRAGEQTEQDLVPNLGSWNSTNAKPGGRAGFLMSIIFMSPNCRGTGVSRMWAAWPA